MLLLGKYLQCGGLRVTGFSQQQGVGVPPGVENVYISLLKALCIKSGFVGSAGRLFRPFHS